jgi:hypothetical protein
MYFIVHTKKDTKKCIWGFMEKQAFQAFQGGNAHFLSIIFGPLFFKI